LIEIELVPKAVIIDIESYQKTLNAINLAKLLSFSETDLKNGNIVTHENAKKRFEKTIGKIKYRRIASKFSDRKKDIKEKSHPSAHCMIYHIMGRYPSLNLRMPPPKGGKRRRQKKEKLGGGHMKALVRLFVIKHPSLIITTLPQEGYNVPEF
jgi:hypothetical protein